MFDIPIRVTLREIEKTRAKLPAQIANTPLLLFEDRGESPGGAGLIEAGVLSGSESMAQLNLHLR
jgi:hypothetical protein